MMFCFYLRMPWHIISVAWDMGLYWWRKRSGSLTVIWWPRHIYLFWWLRHNIWQSRCNLVASPHIYICSGGLATISVSGDFVTISGSLAAISVVCSGWVGQVVSPHGVRLVRGCYGWLWVGISAFMIYLFCICYGPMGFILISVLGQGPDKSDSKVWPVLGYGWVMLHTEFTELTLYFHLCRKSPTIVGLELWRIRSGHINCKVGFPKLVYFYYFYILI